MNVSSTLICHPEVSNPLQIASKTNARLESQASPNLEGEREALTIVSLKLKKWLWRGSYTIAFVILRWEKSRFHGLTPNFLNSGIELWKAVDSRAESTYSPLLAGLNPSATSRSFKTQALRCTLSESEYKRYLFSERLRVYSWHWGDAGR
jgi:hypothetical protein